MSAFKQKNFTSEAGNTYVFQHPGVRMVSKINDASKNKHGVMMEERLSEEILKHVIVQPKMKIDDFGDYQEYQETINAAYAFISGQDKDDDKQAGDHDDRQEGSGAES
ncbi:hypothetical protein [Brevibacillus porteri]|uniref:Uncharacterized protein n=1 Tax=Brevibacillus porteri TaxID=2126350 RepID=A0ABX5FHS3_9BACL|nr:hypothetical protein [Brevibacillus porteri]MED1801781.1 hypothetical protein [Brevibacillus porteri]MED2134912.1 hypothetical protein [Brevibacillus porteri]MED2748419.1 hypothetical protein [Brevibacillus porteri]MED2818343.1 hypothetical protein [Brevibacillus porteri]MED2897698.1 hypothetical protein [Brevibacillus porteri]